MVTDRNREIHIRFHQLWTASVGTDGYFKDEWKEIDAKICLSDEITGSDRYLIKKAEALHRLSAHGSTDVFCCLAPNREK